MAAGDCALGLGWRDDVLIAKDGQCGHIDCRQDQRRSGRSAIPSCAPMMPAGNCAASSRARTRPGQAATGAQTLSANAAALHRRRLEPCCFTCSTMSNRPRRAAGASAPARVSTRINPRTREAYFFQTASAMYPPIERPHTTARSILTYRAVQPGHPHMPPSCKTPSVGIALPNPRKSGAMT